MGLLSFLGALSPAHIQLFTLTRGGKKIGQDMFGNTYYEAKPRSGYKRPRRWVMYKETPEASAVPAEWHGWLHHTYQDPPTDDPLPRKDWEKPHLENVTGSALAYAPAGSLRRAAPAERSDYEAWSPE